MNRRTHVVVTLVAGLAALVATLWLSAACKRLSPAEPPDVIASTPVADLPALRDVQVIVLDAETASPLTNANVKVGTGQGNADKAGVYKASVPNGSTHPVEVQFPGYKRWEGLIETQPPGTAPLTLEVTLEPNTVEGQVVGYDAAPLPNAKITVGARQVEIDDAGRFTLHRVRQGDTLVVEQPGYAKGQVTYNGQSVLRVAMEPLSIAVSVRDAMTGLDLPGISICAENRVCGTTDDNGQVMFRPAVPGTSLIVEGK